MSYLFIEYPKCSTCRKAKNWLLEHGIAFEDRSITEENPTAAQLCQWQQESGLPLRRFFNTSGLRYRELGLKERLDSMDTEEQLVLLASDGMLVKRPLLIGNGTVLVGFREAEWEKSLTGTAEE